MVAVTCLVCGKAEDVIPARSKKYKTCSRECAGKRASDIFSKNVTATCLICGSGFKIKISHIEKRKTCSKKCFAELKKLQMLGDGNHQFGKRGNERGKAFKGGRRISSYGYVLISVGYDKYEFEHRLVMEEIVGRKLDHDEHVHHINGDKQDNRIENLELLSQSTHISMHNKENPMPRDSQTQQFISREIHHEDAVRNAA